MAKVTKKNSDTYLKEKESFLRELQHFHETRGTPCRHTPKIGGKEIDLYLLYCLVTSNGGWVKVNSRNQWNSLLKEFHLPKNCVNVSVALKQIYLRYLDKYEKAHFLGETHNALEDDEDTGGGRHKRWSSVRSTQPAVPLAYNHSQHQITESARATSALSKDLYTASEYDRLALSLLCPLPNEQDFALNVCTLLSNEFRAAQGTPTGIRLARHTRLLRYLLAHAGVFADETLRSYYTDNYRGVRHQSLEAFWDDAVEDRALLSLMRGKTQDGRTNEEERTHLKRTRAREKRRRDTSEGPGINDVDMKEVEGSGGSGGREVDVKATDASKQSSVEVSEKLSAQVSKESSAKVSEESSAEVSKESSAQVSKQSSAEVSKESKMTPLVASNTDQDKVKLEHPDKEKDAAKSLDACDKTGDSSDAVSDKEATATTTDKKGVKSDDVPASKSEEVHVASDTCTEAKGAESGQTSLKEEVGEDASEVKKFDSSSQSDSPDASSKEVAEGSSKGEICKDISEGKSCESLTSCGKTSEGSSKDNVFGGSFKDEVCGGSSKVEVCGSSSKDDVCGGPSKDDACGVPSKGDACGGSSKDDVCGRSSKDDVCGGPSKDKVCGGPSKELCRTDSSASDGRGNVEEGDDFLSDGEDAVFSECGGGKRLKLRLEPEDRGLFALGRGLGTQEWVGQRVLQIATLLRNFTFNEENNALLSGDPTFLRFMVLCCSSNWSCLRQLGLDMFGNVAAALHMDDSLAPVLMDIISRGLGSPDRASVLACVEILNKLGQVEKNEDVLLRSLQQKVYNQVCTLLTLHDIMLLIHTLECVYSLSSLGERACNAIMRVHGAMDVLVSLVTVEAQSFGPKGCILMRVVETVDLNSTNSQEEEEDTTPDPPTTLTTLPPGPPTGLNAPAFSMPMALAPVAVPVPLSQAVPPSAQLCSPASMTPMRHRPPTPTGTPRPPTITPQAAGTSGMGGPQQQGQMTPRHSYRVITPNKVSTSGTVSISGATSANSASGASSSPVPPGTRPPEENGEMFATQWLRANFEHASLPGRAIEQAELYKQYINAASRAGRRGVIAPLHFPRVVRSVFGAQIGPKQVIPAAPPGSTAPPPPPIHVYEGIQVRGKQPIITQTIAIAPSPSQQQQQQMQHNLAQQQNISQQQQIQQSMSQQQHNVVQQQQIKQNLPQQQQNISQQQQMKQNLSQQQQQNVSQQQQMKQNLSQQNIAQQQQIQQNMSQQQQQQKQQTQQNLSQQQQQQNIPQQQLQNISQQQSLSQQQNPSQQNLQQQASQAGFVQQQSSLQNPMSPILKAQLSAPPKPQGGPPTTHSSSLAATPGCSNTARTKAHPHLSQALLGAGTNTPSSSGTPTPPVPTPSTSGGGSTSDPTSTSLIKSLLANKVGPSEPSSSSSSSSPCVSNSSTQPLLVVNTVVASQVTQRQQQAQKMLSQSQGPASVGGSGPGLIKSSGPVQQQQQQQMRLNGVTINMQQATNHVIENSLDTKAPPGGLVSSDATSSSSSSSSVGVNTPPDPPPPLSSQPPPLAPLSTRTREGEETAALLVDGTSVVVNGGISNSINVSADTSDQQYKENIAKQSLMLVDLLEKSIGDKDPPTINGAIRIGEKGLDLFTSIETKSKLAAQGLCPPQNTPGTPTSVLSSSGGVIRRVSSELESQHRANGTTTPSSAAMLNGAEQQVSTGLKRPRSQDAQDSSEAPAVKKVHVNGDVNPACVNVEEEQEENNVKASSTAANLYAALAADVLEDEELITEPQQQAPAPAPSSVQGAPPQQGMLTTSQQQNAASTSSQQNVGVLSQTQQGVGVLTQPQQIQGVLSQSQQGVLTQGQGILTQAGVQGQNIIVTGSGANGRQILVTGGQGGNLPQRLSMMGQHYVVTQQPQLVQGHHPGQTVLVAQTGQQGTAGSKTIIILQPSSSSSSSSSPSHSSSKTIVSSIAASSSSTFTTTSNQKVIVSTPPHPPPAASPHTTSVLHRTPNIRPQTSATVIKPVPDTRPRGSLAQQSGFQAQFIQQTQQQQQVKLSQQQQLQQQQQVKLNQQQQQQLVQQQQQQHVQQQQHLQQQQQQQPPAGQFICEWRGCMRNFKSANEVYMHACASHCPVTPSTEIQCLWERCDVLRRKRFSHMTHLYDRHCNPDVLKMMAVRRKQLTASGKTEIPPPPSPSPHPGYAPNAAFNAIKRHALEFVNPKELQDDNEGPVTKSIRLTSSLILRNLVIYSTTGRRHLVSYEPHLASVALSNVESSKTIAQVLFDMNDTQSRR